MQHIKNNSFPITPKLNSYLELVNFIESYIKSSLYEMRKINGLIFEFETNKILLSKPPKIILYYKYQSEKQYKQLFLIVDECKEFIKKYGIETNDKLLLEQFIGDKLSIEQENIKIFL